MSRTVHRFPKIQQSAIRNCNNMDSNSFENKLVVQLLHIIHFIYNDNDNNSKYEIAI